MTGEEPPTFTGVPVKGCVFYFPKGCRSRSDPEGTSYLLQRAPGNLYDSNAIEVWQGDGGMTGHIAREVAAQVAPWMDAGWFFTCIKTGRVNCWNIVTLTPITGAKAEDTAESVEEPYLAV